MVLAGRRGGKTFLMLERCLKKMAHSKPKDEVYFVGPSNHHAKELAWDYFKFKLAKLGWSHKPMISRQMIELQEERKIYVIGAEKIDRIRGHKVWHVALDEIAYYTHPLADIWKAVRPSLTDRKGSADFGTTPDGKGSDAYEWFMNHKGRFGWSYHHWTSIENPYLDPTEIEEAKRDLDEKAFNQEYLATWETYEGLAYYNFDEGLHVAPCSAISLQHELVLSFDFNVNPTTLLLSQLVGHKKYIRREYSFADSSTERTVKAFIEDYIRGPRVPIKLRGDAAGNQRKSTTGKSDYQYIHEALSIAGIKFTHEVPLSNPAIIDRVNAVNGWLKPMAGDPKIVIDPSCKQLIRDLAGQKTEGRLPSPANNMGHKADALGYDVYWDHLMSKRPQSVQRGY